MGRGAVNTLTNEVRSEVVSVNRDGCTKTRTTLNLRKIMQATKPQHTAIPDWINKGILDASLIHHIYTGRYDLCYATMRQAGVLDGYMDGEVATSVGNGNGRR